jgi:hypothetical protein
MKNKHNKLINNELSELSYKELRELLLNDKLEHDDMSERDYELLFDNVEDSDESINVILKFCIDGFKMCDFYKELENIEIDMSDLTNKGGRKTLISQIEAKKKLRGRKLPSDYSKLPYEELRNMVLGGAVKRELMSQSKYEYLLEREAELAEPDIMVLEFCTTGLKTFDEYKDYDDVIIYGEAVRKFVDRRKTEQEVLNVFYNGKPKYKKPKRAVILLVAVASAFIITTVTSTAMGQSIVDLSFKVFRDIIPEKTPASFNGNGVNVTSDVRYYDSMSEMIEAENLDILYPVELPDGYNFTNFVFSDFGFKLEVMAYAEEPRISFSISIGEDINVYNYDYEYEANGIKYSIVEIEDNMYQALWVRNGDYYSIANADKAVLSEIIRNLKES